MKKFLIILFCFVAVLVGTYFIKSNINENVEEKIHNSTINTPDKIIEIPSPVVIPENVEKDEFSYVYAAIVLDLISFGYDVFNAIAKSSSVCEYGIGYCDYESGYQFDNDENIYLSSGFLSFSSNSSTKINYMDTIYLDPIDEKAEELNEENIRYIVEYVENGLPNGHFIVNDKYIKYNVYDGNVKIDSMDNNFNNYDLSLGSIYNYDKEDYEIIPYDDISSDPIEYVALTNKIDVQELKDSLYSLVEEQEIKGYKLESITISYISIDALNALKGLLSQNVSLNGYSLEYLDSVEFDNKTQYINFNGDGSITIRDLPPISLTETKDFFDWLVDGLVLTGAGAIAIVSAVFLGPAGGVIAAGVVGAGIQYFSETVIEGKKISDVNWSKVGIMSISGALGAVIPCSGFIGYVAAGALGGVTSAAMTAVDGGTMKEILISGAEGAIVAVITHGLFSSCFPAGTKVLTEHGELPIEEITIGTLIASYNIFSNKVEYMEVLDTYKSYSSEYTKIIFIDGTEIISTSNHPYYDVSKKQYIYASDLTDKSILVNEKGERVYIDKVINYFDDQSAVYNLNIRKNHNYYVGDQLVLVHNKCTDAARNKAGQSARKEALDDIVNGNYSKWGLNPNNADDFKIIEFVQEKGRWPNLKNDGFQCEFAHAVDVNKIAAAFENGKISEGQYIEYISSSQNGILTSHDSHFNILHSGNYANSTNYDVAIRLRPSIAEYVHKILENIGLK